MTCCPNLPKSVCNECPQTESAERVAWESNRKTASRPPRKLFRRFRRCLHLRALVAHGLRMPVQLRSTRGLTVGLRVVRIFRSPFDGRRVIQVFRSPFAMSARRRSLRNGLRGSPCPWESMPVGVHACGSRSTPDASCSADFGVAFICGHSLQVDSL